MATILICGSLYRIFRTSPPDKPTNQEDMTMVDVHAHQNRLVKFQRLFMGLIIANVILHVIFHLIAAVVIDQVINESVASAAENANHSSDQQVEVELHGSIYRAHVRRLSHHLRTHVHDAEFYRHISHAVMLYLTFLGTAVGALFVYGASREYRFPVVMHGIGCVAAVVWSLTAIGMGHVGMVVPLAYQAAQIWVSFVLLELLRTKSHFRQAFAEAGYTPTTASGHGSGALFGHTVEMSEKKNLP